MEEGGSSGDGATSGRKKSRKFIGVRRKIFRGSQKEVIRFFIMWRDNFMCLYCKMNKRLTNRDLTIDHIKPRCLGGRSTYDNLATACLACNVKKGHDELSPEIMAELRGLIAKGRERFEHLTLLMMPRDVEADMESESAFMTKEEAFNVEDFFKSYDPCDDDFEYYDGRAIADM